MWPTRFVGTAHPLFHPIWPSCGTDVHPQVAQLQSIDYALVVLFLRLCNTRWLSSPSLTTQAAQHFQLCSFHPAFVVLKLVFDTALNF